MLYNFCEGCPEACDKAKAERLMSARTCDPCDACFNESSPVCTDCGDDFANFEAADHADEEVKYPR